MYHGHFLLSQRQAIKLNRYLITLFSVRRKLNTVHSMYVAAPQDKDHVLAFSASSSGSRSKYLTPAHHGAKPC
jgi:hypothetical protein